MSKCEFSCVCYGCGQVNVVVMGTNEITPLCMFCGTSLASTTTEQQSERNKRMHGVEV